MNPMVSVIIPVYNREAYIEECVQSILAQTYSHFEILIIDDGSIDKTLEICEAMAKSHYQIKLFKGSHQGISAARNIGLEQATGKYILFVDSDDIIHPNLCMTLIEGMESTGAAMGGTIVNRVSEKMWETVAESVRAGTNSSQIVYYDFPKALQMLFAVENPFSVMGGVIMRRDWIGETRFCTDLKIGEDFYFSYENLIKGTGIIALMEKWYFLRIHRNNSSWDFSYTGFLSRLRRRELVWKNEEKMGRQQYADKQKQDAYGIFLHCIKQAGAFSPDGKQIRKTMKQYRRVIAPAMSLKSKLVLYTILYLPFTTPILMKLK